MNISNISSTYQSCEETQRMRNRSASSEKLRAANKKVAENMIKQGKFTIANIAEKTGISRESIRNYKLAMKAA